MRCSSLLNNFTLIDDMVSGKQNKKKILFLKVLKNTAVMVELHVFPSFHNKFGQSETIKNGKYLWFTEQHLNELITQLNDVALAKVLSGGPKTRNKLLKQQNSTSNLSVSVLDLNANYYFKRRHANELFVVPSCTGKHENFKLFQEKLVVIVSQLETENTKPDTHSVQVESAQLFAMTPTRPGISGYFNKQVEANVTDSTKKKQLTLQNIIRRAEIKQPGTTKPLPPLYTTPLAVTEDVARLNDDSGNNADADCSSKHNLKISEHDPLTEGRTPLLGFEKKYIDESSDGKSDQSGIKDFQEIRSSTVEVRSGDQQKACEEHSLTNSVMVKETRLKELKTKGKESLKLKKRKIGCNDVTSGSETVDIDLSDFELKPKTGTKRLRQNSTTETLEPTARQNTLKMCSMKDVEDMGTKKGRRGHLSKLKTRKGRKGVAQKTKTKGRNRLQEQNSTLVSEELTSEDEQLRYNKKACMMERVDEETEDPDALAESTRVQGSMATSKAADRPRKGSVIEINDDCCETITRGPITIQDNSPDFSNVKRIENLTLDHIDHIVWSKKAELRCIFEGKKHCQRHEDYKKGGKLKDDLLIETFKNDLGNLAFQVRFGVFSDEQQEAMMDALISMFCYKHSKYLDYVTKVLLPETMVMVYQEIFKVSSEQVEELLTEETSAKV